MSSLIVAALSIALPQPSFHTPRWIAQQSGTTASLRGLCVVDDNVAWASGTGGTFLRTTDAGQTWNVATVPGAVELDFRDVHAFDASSAVLLSSGEVARLYRTEDSGRSWTQVYECNAPGAFLDAMAFWDNSHGIAIGDPIAGKFLIVTTSDGGRTWQPVAADRIPPALPGEAAFAASGTCLAVAGQQSAWFGTGGSSARVFCSPDRGQSWSVVETPMAHGQPSAGVFSLAFPDERRGVMVGGDYENPAANLHIAARTSDGGLTWLPSTGNPPGGYRSCVAHLPSVAGGQAFIAVGPTGSDISTDGGQSWQLFDPTPLNTAAFSPTGHTGWAVGPQGRIAKFAAAGQGP